MHVRGKPQNVSARYAIQHNGRIENSKNCAVHFSARSGPSEYLVEIISLKDVFPRG